MKNKKKQSPGVVLLRRKESKERMKEDMADLAGFAVENKWSSSYLHHLCVLILTNKAARLDLAENASVFVQLPCLLLDNNDLSPPF
ncbi:MAG: hypothetical protein HQM06_16655 [Magnetococcales bacterium]|nr:hypothetical protein [Magnetococcales bacterium]